MELRNIERAKELLPQLEALQEAKKALAKEDCDVTVRVNGNECAVLPQSVRMNILSVLNCEYERVRKEVSEL